MTPTVRFDGKKMNEDASPISRKNDLFGANFGGTPCKYLQGVPPKLAPKRSFLREIGEASSFIFFPSNRTVGVNIGAPVLPLD